MQINWFTFAAQIVNFLVLVWLLNRFLYGPVVRAMDDREQRITERLNEADAARDQAEQAAEEHRRKTDELQHAKDDLLAEAGREIEQWKADHRAAARKEFDESRREWQRALSREKTAFLRDLRRRAGEHVFETARLVLSRLSDVSLEKRIIDSFIDRLHGLSREACQLYKVCKALAHGEHCKQDLAGRTCLVVFHP